MRKLFIGAVIALGLVAGLATAKVIKESKQDEATSFYNNNGGTVEKTAELTATGKLQVDEVTDLAGTGAPEFASGLASEALSAFEAPWTGSTSINDIASFSRNGAAVRSAIGYDDVLTDIYIGTSTAHDFTIRANGAAVIRAKSQGHANITGATDGSTAPSGIVGEVIEQITATGNITLSSTHVINSISLTAGTWLVQAHAEFTMSAGTVYYALLNPGVLYEAKVGVGSLTSASSMHWYVSQSGSTTLTFRAECSGCTGTITRGTNNKSFLRAIRIR